jgi:putative FmdB family regulatory protein
MPRYDFHCDTCNLTKELVLSSYQAAGNIKCVECGSTLTKLPPAPNFTITGYNAKNGYSKSDEPVTKCRDCGGELCGICFNCLAWCDCYLYHGDR